MALSYLLKNRDLLASHEVTVEFHPIFLGGVNVGSGNKPPWTLPAKAKYGKFDVERTKKYHDLENASPPDFFPPLTLLPQRALCYVKARHPQSTFDQIFLALFHALWNLHVNITLPGPFTDTLETTGLFAPPQISDIVSATKEQEWKDKLLANTQKVLDQGAFGAPWMWVQNGEGKEEPFFGSDRFHFMWTFLGVPFRDIEITPPKAKL
ncbi:thioredoxin-like protein [Hyaloscypha bicolor E]|uniref:Glutathione S-transferase kappa n=1 Tax=Hyaloscypha bicolor E TaxID=1095630 RepID=A0A2J6TUJ0_9HELO|nr:thioredoxin-like protein [Hyaloscypha bicolor E]PMD66675.1 thioredoxin-like protein [Hyaloscypha bicolor E]